MLNLKVFYVFFFILQRHLSQVNFETLNCPGVFCFKPAKKPPDVQSRAFPLWFMNLCLTCFTFEDPSELTCPAKACRYLLDGSTQDNLLSVLFSWNGKKRDGTDFRVTGLTCIGSTGFCIHLEKIAYLLHPFLYLKYNAKTSSLLAQLSIESGNI